MFILGVDLDHTKAIPLAFQDDSRQVIHQHVDAEGGRILRTTVSCLLGVIIPIDDAADADAGDVDELPEHRLTSDGIVPENGECCVLGLGVSIGGRLLQDLEVIPLLPTDLLPELFTGLVVREEEDVALPDTDGAELRQTSLGLTPGMPRTRSFPNGLASTAPGSSGQTR